MVYRLPKKGKCRVIKKNNKIYKGYCTMADIIIRYQPKKNQILIQTYWMNNTNGDGQDLEQYSLVGDELVKTGRCKFLYGEEPEENPVFQARGQKGNVMIGEKSKNYRGIMKQLHK